MDGDKGFEVKFEVTLNLSEFKKTFENEDGTGKENTAEVMEELRSSILNCLKNPRNQDSLKEACIEHILNDAYESDASIEGIDSIEEWCEIEMSLETGEE